MSERHYHSLKVLDHTFSPVTAEDTGMILGLLAHLRRVRDYKTDPVEMLTEGLKAENDIQRYMVIYLAVSTLMLKDNRRVLKKFTQIDLRDYNKSLYRKMVNISQISYDHFKRVLDA